MYFAAHSLRKSGQRLQNSEVKMRHISKINYIFLAFTQNRSTWWKRVWVIPGAFSQILFYGHRQHGPQSQLAHLLHGLRDLTLVLSGHKLGVYSGPQQQGEPPPPQEGARYRHQLQEEEDGDEDEEGEADRGVMEIEDGETRGDTEAVYPRCFRPCDTHSFLLSPVGLIYFILLQMSTNSSPTFPQLFTSTGKEQRRKTPRARSSSPHVFTLKALGSSKARVAERRSGCLAATDLEATVPSSLSDNSWGIEGRKWEHIILPGKVCVCTWQDKLVGGVSVRGVLYKSSFVVIFWRPVS